MANAVTVWTGRQVLTWGGGCCDDYSAGGAAYTPATNTWQRLPASPLEGRHATGAWTGKELIVVGGIGKDNGGNVVGYKVFADAAAYDPAAHSWRRLSPMPAPRAGASVTWDGTEVLVVGGRGALGSSRLYADGVAYNPSTNRWRRLPTMGTGRFGHTAGWTGRHLLVWGGRTFRGGAWTAPARGGAYDPVGNRWWSLPISPLRGRVGHLAVWTGSRMLVWGGSPARESDPQQSFTDGAAYMPTPL